MSCHPGGDNSLHPFFLGVGRSIYIYISHILILFCLKENKLPPSSSSKRRFTNFNNHLGCCHPNGFPVSRCQPTAPPTKPRGRDQRLPSRRRLWRRANHDQAQHWAPQAHEESQRSSVCLSFLSDPLRWGVGRWFVLGLEKKRENIIIYVYVYVYI